MVPPTPPPGARGRSPKSPNALRLVTPSEPTTPAHPLTTLATSLLPARDAAGNGGSAHADVWEELDRAAGWVYDHWVADPAAAGSHPGGERTDERNAVRQALRVVCVAARTVVAIGSARPGSAQPSGAGEPFALGPGALPWNVPVAALLPALQRRLVAQTVAAEGTGEPTADPRAVLRVLSALERIGESVRADATRMVVDQLTGASSLDLLVEVAHDMRSPLGSILFLVERLRVGDGRRGAASAEGKLTDAQDRQLALIYGAAFGLSAMVGDVMELARGGDRLAGGEPASVSLGEIVASVTAIARPLAEEKRLALVVGEAPREARLGHAAAVQRVLLNLVTNALKYTPEGTVTLRVEPVGRTRVSFIIEDTGRGIPPQVLANLFQTFRLRAARDYAFSSAGLGLAICQKLVAAMGGELAVDSEAGRGTRFSFELEMPPVSPIL
jgi:hypothetical protein